MRMVIGDPFGQEFRRAARLTRRGADLKMGFVSETMRFRNK
jgi:hypothetical protein